MPNPPNGTPAPPPISTPIIVAGYGNLTPKTDLGKLATILYAVLGIPLMFLYMRNMGNVLGDSFKYVYAKMCR